jgi:hypothetical protein
MFILQLTILMLIIVMPLSSQSPYRYEGSFAHYPYDKGEFSHVRGPIHSISFYRSGIRPDKYALKDTSAMSMANMNQRGEWLHYVDFLNSYDFHYAYDSLDRISSIDAKFSSRNPDANKRLMRNGGTEYIYDYNGRETSPRSIAEYAKRDTAMSYLRLYEYDRSGRRSNMITLRGNPRDTIQIEHYIYEHGGRITLTEVSAVSSPRHYKSIYRYDSGLNLISESHQSSDSGGTLNGSVYSIRYINNRRGDPVKEIVRRNDGKSDTLDYSYSYDSFGNWTKQTQIARNSPKSGIYAPILSVIRTRTIEYFPQFDKRVRK